MIKRIFCILVVAFSLSAFAGPLSWQTFSYGKLSWICSSKSIYVFSTDSRTVYPLSLDQTRTVGTISDVIESDNSLLFSTEAGIYQIDMSTQSIERIPFSDDKNKVGKIASDMDYLWLATNDSLFRFDKLGREWTSYSLPEKSNIKALQSDGVNVECLSGNNAFSFVVNTEKWNSYSTNTNFNDSVSFYHGMKSLIALTDKIIFVYNSGAHLWEKNEINNSITDFFVDDTVMIYAAGDRLMRMSNGVSRTIDIPNNGQVYAVGKSSDTLFIALKSGIMKYNLRNSAISLIEYPMQVQGFPEKIIIKRNFIVALYSNAFAIYNNESKTWSISIRVEKKSLTKVSWEEQGPIIQYKPGFFTNLKGSVESKMSLRSSGFEYKKSALLDSFGNQIYDSLNDPVFSFDSTDSTPILLGVKPDIIADVNLHSTDPDGRILDITFNNVNKSIPPEKKISYKGTPGDNLNSLTAGTCQTDLMQSQLYTPVRYEGGQLIAESKSKVDGRDRKIVRVGGGAGYITTRTQWKVLPYQASGMYPVGNNSGSTSNDSSSDSSSLLDSIIETGKTGDTIQILPGSMRVWVDGSLLDSVHYTFYLLTSTLEIKPNAPVDPVSLITVSYDVQPVPEKGNDFVEFKPKYNFGRIYYGTTTISPLNWLSARISAEGVDSDTMQPVINTALPLEFRKDKPDLFIKLTPEFSYNTKNKSKASAVDFQSRIGKNLGLVFNGIIADTHFTTADTFTRGYGKIRNSYNAGINYDILPQIPFSYSQSQYVGASGSELNYLVHTGAHFAKTPFFDLDISRTVLEDNTEDTSNTFDSLFHIKDRISFKLYEISSPFLENLTRSKKVAYELIHTEYRYQGFDSDEFENGRKTYGKLTYIPIHPITFIGQSTYKHGDLGNGVTSQIKPIIDFLTFDFPRGVDINGSYSASIAKYSAVDSTTDIVSRMLRLTLKPGRWNNKLGWFSLYGQTLKNSNCEFSTSQPVLGDLIGGSENVTSSLLVNTLGFNIFPNESSVFTNKNDWTVDDTNKKFITINDLQVIFNSRNSWNSSFSYLTDYTFYSLSGSTDYTYKLTSWLHLEPKIRGGVQTDSTGNKITGGGQLSTNFYIEKWLIIKSLLCDQSVSLDWKRMNGHTSNHPAFSYDFTFDVLIQPNIKLKANGVVSYENGAFNNFTGKLVSTIIF